MYRKTYKVKGEDVNDFMVMQNVAYFSYASRVLYNYLFEKGYSKRKLKQLKLRFQKCEEKLICKRHLMFTQPFFVNFEYYNIEDNKQNVSIKSSFFNTRNELCATVITKLYWCNLSDQRVNL